MTHPIDVIRAMIPDDREIDEESFARARAVWIQPEELSPFGGPSTAGAVVPISEGYSFHFTAQMRPVEAAIRRLGEDRARQQLTDGLFAMLGEAPRMETFHSERYMTPEQRRVHRRQAARDRATRGDGG